MKSGPPAQDIQKLFNHVAHKYDLANDVMTFGLARRWRKQLVQWSGVKNGGMVLDCATGTGDLALEFKKAVGPEGQVIGTDFCEGMLALAPAKAKHLKLDVTFQVADVLQLPFANNTFDAVSIAYGIRNVEDPLQALKEMARVVRPGGYVLVLETGDSPSLGLKSAIEFYSAQIVPRIGGWITGDRAAYEYLNSSSRKFPSRENFLELISQTKTLTSAEMKVLLGGASFLYRALKPSHKF